MSFRIRAAVLNFETKECPMPHQPVKLLLTKLAWLPGGLKLKVKGELTRRGLLGSVYG
jgi:hypothetical protein